MPTPAKGPRLGGSPAHERLILANLATSLFEHGRITTTETRAKRLRPLAERLITFAKRGDLAARRRVLRVVRDKGVVHVLFTEVGPQMAERPGGYTRITKVGPRKGDNAPMAVIELVTEPLSPKKAVVREAERATARSARAGSPKGGAATSEAAPTAQEPTPGTAEQDTAPVADEQATAPEQATPADATTADAAPADAAPADEAPAAPADSGDAAPVDEAPVDEVPAEEAGSPARGRKAAPEA